MGVVLGFFATVIFGIFQTLRGGATVEQVLAKRKQNPAPAEELDPEADGKSPSAIPSPSAHAITQAPSRPHLAPPDPISDRNDNLP